MHDYEETIGRTWAAYLRDMVPADAGPVQVRESRQAFRAGAWALYCAFMAMSGDEVGEDQGVIWLEAIGRELRGFMMEARDQ